MTATEATSRCARRARRTPISRLSRPVVALCCALLLAAVGGCTATVAGTAVSALSRVTPALLCPGIGTARQDAPALVACISTSVSDYWTSVVGKPVQEPVVVAPEPDAVPEACRSFLSFGTAFYCPANATVYITAASLDRDASAFGDGLPYALAVIVAHEVGHVAQDVVDQPGFDDPDPTDAQLRATEQQADCLVGVWVRHAARAGQVNPVTFRAAAKQELTLISQLRAPPGVGLDGYDEVATHGTVDQRLAALDQGLAGGTGTACGLVGVEGN